jgi:hypothetical protein
MPKVLEVKTLVVTIIAKKKIKSKESFSDFVKRMRKEYAERTGSDRVTISVVS